MRLQKHAFLSIVLGVSFVASATAHAGLWDDTKEAASSAWESTKEVTKDTASDIWGATKETSRDIKDGTVEKWDEITTSEDEKSSSLSDLKKLGEKETYVKAWEGVKESVKNPSEASEDEHGIPN